MVADRPRAAIDSFAGKRTFDGEIAAAPTD
jgi:hypothetical protein